MKYRNRISFIGAIAAAVVLSSTPAVAQSWLTTGNVLPPGGGVLGSLNSQDVVLITDNQPRLRLNASGTISTTNVPNFSINNGSLDVINGGVSIMNGWFHLNGGPVHINANGPVDIMANMHPMNINAGPLMIQSMHLGLHSSAGINISANGPIQLHNPSDVVDINTGSVHLNANGPIHLHNPGNMMDIQTGPIQLNANGPIHLHNPGHIVDIHTGPMHLNAPLLDVNVPAIHLNGFTQVMGDHLVQGRFGINVTTTLNSFDIAGQGVIGSGYAATTLAPLNGLLVENEVGIGYPNNPGTYQLYVNGSVYATAGYFSSDMRWKENVARVEGALAKVLEMRGVTYTYKQKEFPNLRFPEGKQLGFIAQELERVVPEVVVTNSDGYKVVAYQNLTAILTEAIQEQQTQIQKLQSRIDRLEAALGLKEAPAVPSSGAAVSPDLR